MCYTNNKNPFQAHKRDAEIVLGRAIYIIQVNNNVDFLVHLGFMDIYPLSSNLKEIQNYLTLIKPLDKYVWCFLAASVFSITLAIILIDQCYTSWINLATKSNNITYHSMYAYSGN